MLPPVILRAPWRFTKAATLWKLSNWLSLSLETCSSASSLSLSQQLIHAPNSLPSLSKHHLSLLSSRSRIWLQTIPDCHVWKYSPHATRAQFFFPLLLLTFWTDSLSSFRLPTHHNNLELLLNNSFPEIQTQSNHRSTSALLNHHLLSLHPPYQSSPAHSLGNRLYLK